MKLYNEMREAMSEVMKAEANARAWAQEARALMKDVDVIIRAAQKIDPEARKLNIQEIRSMLRDDLTPGEADAPEADETEPATEDEPTDEIPEPATAGTM